MTYRRIVTGFDQHARSCVIEDRRIEETTMGNTHLWLRGPGEHEDDCRQSAPFFPTPGQSVFRIVRLPSPESGMTPAQLSSAADGFFRSIGDSWCRSDTTLDPFMHRTPTTDYITLLSGQVALLLETGQPVHLEPFDTVVQRHTNHAWQVRGKEPAILLCVMIGEPRDDLA